MERKNPIAEIIGKEEYEQKKLQGRLEIGKIYLIKEEMKNESDKN